MTEDKQPNEISEQRTDEPVCSAREDSGEKKKGFSLHGYSGWKAWLSLIIVGLMGLAFLSFAFKVLADVFKEFWWILVPVIVIWFLYQVFRGSGTK